MDEEEYHLQSKFCYPEDLETSEAGISESQNAIDDFINKQKSENRKGRRLLIWTLYSVLLKLMAWIVKQLKAYLRPSLTTFCHFFFMNVRRKNGEYKPATFSSFQRNI